MAAFVYPEVPHSRRHGPKGYADCYQYHPWLRDEFSFRCVYCLSRERWGKGHYDTTLAQNPHALRVGICFQEQIEASIPCDPTDEPMDWVVSDSKVYAGRRRAAVSRPKEDL